MQRAASEQADDKLGMALHVHIRPARSAEKDRRRPQAEELRLPVINLFELFELLVVYSNKLYINC